MTAPVEAPMIVARWWLTVVSSADDRGRTGAVKIDCEMTG